MYDFFPFVLKQNLAGRSKASKTSCWYTFAPVLTPFLKRWNNFRKTFAWILSLCLLKILPQIKGNTFMDFNCVPIERLLSSVEPHLLQAVCQKISGDIYLVNISIHLEIVFCFLKAFLWVRSWTVFKVRTTRRRPLLSLSSTVDDSDKRSIIR